LSFLTTTPPPPPYTLSLHDALPIYLEMTWLESVKFGTRYADRDQDVRWTTYNWQNVANNWTGNQAGYYNLDKHSPDTQFGSGFRSEEHTSELQSRENLVCRLLLEKK